VHVRLQSAAQESANNANLREYIGFISRRLAYWWLACDTVDTVVAI